MNLDYYPDLIIQGQRKDCSYQFAFTDAGGKRCFVYSWRLVPSDLTPKNKKETKSLRELEKEIQAEIREGVYSARKYSVNPGI